MAAIRHGLIPSGLAALCLSAGAAAGAGDATPAQDGSAILSQGDWAKLLVERLGVSSGLRANASAEDAASLLGARGFALSRDAKAATTVTADGAQKTWRYDVEVPRTATWLVTLGNGQAAFASVDKGQSKLVAAGGTDGASDVGLFALSPGVHSIVVTSDLPAAPDLSIVAGCHPVLPAGGWQVSAKLSYGNLGRTLVQALRQNGRLPASDGLGVVPVSAGKVSIDVPSEGNYTLLLGGKALEHATYRVGGCEETIPGAPTADGWREGNTLFLSSGAQTLELFGADAKKSDGRVRLVRRSSADAEYLAVLQSMGVKLSADGKTTGSLEPEHTRTGLARRANGDSTAGLAALAGKLVTRDEALRILSSPAVAKGLGGGMNFPKKSGTGPKTKEDDLEKAGTLEDPVTGTLQQLQDADPQ